MVQTAQKLPRPFDSQIARSARIMSAACASSTIDSRLSANGTTVVLARLFLGDMFLR